MQKPPALPTILGGPSMFSDALASSVAKSLKKAQKAEKKPIRQAVADHTIPTNQSYEQMNSINSKLRTSLAPGTDKNGDVKEISQPAKLGLKQLLLIKAINSADQQTLSQLLRDPDVGDLNFSINGEGLTPLMVACVKKNPQIVSILLESRLIDVDKVNKAGLTALHLATLYKSMEIIQVLIEQGKALYCKSFNGTTPLHIAVKQGEFGIVKYFVESMGVDVNAVREIEDGEQLQAQPTLGELASSEEIGMTQESGMTPLKLAVTKGFNEIAEYLITKGAKIQAEQFYHACKKGKLGLARIISQNLLATLDGNVEKFRETVVNVKYEKTNSTPLTKACDQGHLDLVKFLIDEFKASMKIISGQDESCLLAAVKANRIGIVKYLTSISDSSLDINFEQPSNGLNALSLSILSNFNDISTYLISSCKMNPDGKNIKEGVTVMDIAKRTGNKEALKFLGKLKLQSMRDKVYKPVTLIAQVSFFSYISHFIEEIEEHKGEIEKEVVIKMPQSQVKGFIELQKELFEACFIQKVLSVHQVINMNILMEDTFEDAAESPIQEQLQQMNEEIEEEFLVDETPMNARGELLEIPEEFSDQESAIAQQVSQPFIRILSPLLVIPVDLMRVMPQYFKISYQQSDSISQRSIYEMESVKTDSLLIMDERQLSESLIQQQNTIQEELQFVPEEIGDTLPNEIAQAPLSIPQQALFSSLGEATATQENSKEHFESPIFIREDHSILYERNLTTQTYQAEPQMGQIKVDGSLQFVSSFHTSKQSQQFKISQKSMNFKSETIQDEKSVISNGISLGKLDEVEQLHETVQTFRTIEEEQKSQVINMPIESDHEEVEQPILKQEIVPEVTQFRKSEDYSSIKQSLSQLIPSEHPIAVRVASQRRKSSIRYSIHEKEEMVSSKHQNAPQLASIVELQGVQSYPQLHLISAIEITQDLKQLNSNSSKTLKSFYKDSVATPIILKGPQILRKDSSVSKKSKKPSEYMLLDEQIKENSYVKDEKQIEQLDSGLQNQQALKLSPEKEISENATQAIKKALSLQKLLQVQPTIEIAHQKPQYGIVYREDELDENQRTMNQSSFSSNFTQNIPKPDGNQSKSEQDHEKSLSLKSPLLKSNNMGSQHASSLRSKMSSNRSLQRDLSGLAKSAEYQANPDFDQLAIQHLTASQQSNQDQNSSIQILQAIQDSQTTDHQVTHHEQMLHNFRKFEKRIKRLEGLSVSSISSDPQFIEQIVSLKETLNIIQKSTSSLDLEDTNQLQKYQERRMEKLFDFEERLRRLECGFNGTGDEQPLAILEEDYETNDHQQKDSDADELESSLNSKELALIEMVNKDAELKKKDSTDEVKSLIHEQPNGIQQSKQQLSGADNTFQRESSQNLQKLEASKHVKNSLIQKTNSSQFKSEDLSEDDLMRGDSSVKLEGSIVYGRKNHPKRTVFDKISLEMKNEEKELQAQTSLAEQIQTLKSEDKKIQQQNIQDDPATIEQISKNQQTLLETNAQNEMSGEPNSQNLRKSEYKLVKTQSGRQIRIRKETPPSLQLVNIRQVEIVNPSKQPYLNARKLSNMDQSYEEELQKLNDDIVRASQEMNPKFMGRRNAQQTKTSANSPRNDRVRESQQALRQSMTQSRLRQRQQDEGKQQLPSLSAIRFVGPKSIAQSVLTTYNKESIARSVGKLVKLTSNDYYKQKLQKNQEQIRKDYIQSTLDNPTYRSGVDASTIDQSELSRPTTLLMLHKQPQVYEKRDIFSFQQQNLLKLAMENPKNAMQAAANVQLSLLKLKQIKDMYRNRYKIDGFTSDQSPALVDQQPLYITQSLI